MKTRLQKKLEEAMRVSIEHKEKEGLELVVLTEPRFVKIKPKRVIPEPPDDVKSKMTMERWAWYFEALTEQEFGPRDDER